jgi:hypothetical protein
MYLIVWINRWNSGRRGFLKKSFGLEEANAIVAIRNEVRQEEFYWVVPFPTIPKKRVKTHKKGDIDETPIACARPRE